MKDKTLYWILGIIAAYFLVRFIMNQIYNKPKLSAKTALNTFNINYKGVALNHDDDARHQIGEQGPDCEVCGSTTHYKNGGSKDNPIPWRVCDNGNCRTNMDF